MALFECPGCGIQHDINSPCPFAGQYAIAKALDGLTAAVQAIADKMK